jgi:hypothetical protein
MSLLDKLSGLVGGHDDDEPDDGDPKGEVPCDTADTVWLKKKAALEDGCFVSVGGLIGDLADAEASIDYQHPDSLPDVDAGENAGLSVVEKLEREAE